MIIQLPNGNSINIPDNAPPQTKLDYYRLCLDMINDAISVINQNASTDENNISNLQTGLTNADNNIATLTTQAANLQSDINTINGEITNINTRIGMGGNANFTNLAGGSKMIWLIEPINNTGITVNANDNIWFNYPIVLPSTISTVYFLNAIATVQAVNVQSNEFYANNISLPTDIVGNNISLFPQITSGTPIIKISANISISGGNLIFNINFNNNGVSYTSTKNGIIVHNLLLIGA